MCVCVCVWVCVCVCDISVFEGCRVYKESNRLYINIIGSS